MRTAVDTNVLIDVLIADPTHGAASSAALRKAIQAGTIVACDVVWAEVASCYKNASEFHRMITELGIEFLPLTEKSSELAGRMWKSYRSRGGTREHLIPDFFVAAHATEQCDRLLTRDRGFYRKYFTNLKLFLP